MTEQMSIMELVTNASPLVQLGYGCLGFGIACQLDHDYATLVLF